MTQTGSHFKPLRRLALAAAIFAVGWGGPATAIPPPPPQGLFLDCARQVFATESFICRDPALLARDAALRVLYDDAAARTANGRMSLEADQRAWTAERNRCAFRSDQRRCVEDPTPPAKRLWAVDRPPFPCVLQSTKERPCPHKAKIAMTPRETATQI